MDIKSVYDRQHQRIYRLAMLYLKNPTDAEDAVHNVFLRYMERLPVFEGSGHEEGWFVTVTRNYCKDQLRTCWYRKVSLGDIPERMDQEKEDYQLLEHMMKLPAKYREVLYLYYYEGYSVQEMSRLLSRKESIIQTQLARARAYLKTELEKEGKWHG